MRAPIRHYGVVGRLQCLRQPSQIRSLQEMVIGFILGALFMIGLIIYLVLTLLF
jgi:hypothetical protein